MMELIILGLLMAQKCTIYELRKLIQLHFTNMSSSSMGSIQATIKKLLEKKMICFSEHLENSVNKKVYEITSTGKDYFFTVASSPLQYKEKNMELSKFFFMGFVPSDTRISLIDEYIIVLRKQLTQLKNVETSTLPRYNFDQNYLKTLKEKGAADEITSENLDEIARFQYATLDFSIAKLEFEIQWFEQFREREKKLCPP